MDAIITNPDLFGSRGQKDFTSGVLDEGLCSGSIQLAQTHTRIPKARPFSGSHNGLINHGNQLFSGGLTWGLVEGRNAEGIPEGLPDCSGLVATIQPLIHGELGKVRRIKISFQVPEPQRIAQSNGRKSKKP
tara:strand:+ start:75 stop:470 length:396 start_codon:yes stop_codon:yes gene_type:complete